jgi:hypothetical protein
VVVAEPALEAEAERRPVPAEVPREQERAAQVLQAWVAAEAKVAAAQPLEEPWE